MLVTIIIPTYNRATMIAQAIKSVQEQTYPHKQIIVVDDGSTDNTKEIVKQFVDVEYVYQKNQRQAAARTSGLKLAKGEFIATLDSDDAWDKNFLTKSVECMEKHNLDFVFSSWIAIKNNNQVPSAWEVSNKWKKFANNSDGRWFLLSPKEVRKLYVHTCPSPSSTLLIRKSSIVTDWNSQLKIADDWCFILDMVLEKNCKAAFTLDCLCTKGIHSENIYHGRSRREVALDLEIHDMRLMKKRYLEKLSFREKMVFNKRIIRGKTVAGILYVGSKFGFKSSEGLLRSKLETFE